MKRVSVIGAGNVGGMTALRIAESGLANVALIDVAPNLAQAKSFDIEDAQYSLHKAVRVEASQDLGLLDGSDIVVVTAGLARKPGMTREDLLKKNAEIMDSVCSGIKENASHAIVIVVSNPLDAMTYLAFKKLGFARERVFGMGVGLDTSRFANLISKKLFVAIELIDALVIGSHGETMLPLPRLTTVRNKALSSLLSEVEIAELVEKTKKRGAEIVSLYGSGSAYFAPSAAIYEIVEAIINDSKKELPVCAVLDGEYNMHDVAIGVPVVVGSYGISKIVELDLTDDERQAFVKSAESIKDFLSLLKIT